MHALDGIRVLDLTRLAPGPHCTILAGVLSRIGPKDRPPSIPLNLVADFAGGGFHGAIGILAALYVRERTGRGQVLDVSALRGRGVVR